MSNPATSLSYSSAISVDNPVGDDPRYLDEFESIRIEIDKLTGCDFEFVENRARFILLEKAKDLRVCGYLLLALTFKHGHQGLIEGLNIYCDVFDTFSEEVHPKRCNAKVSALKWLNQSSRLLSFIMDETIKQASDLTRLTQLIDKLNQLISKRFGQYGVEFTLLNNWLKSQQALALQTAPKPKLIDKLKPKKAATKPVADEILIENQKQFNTTSRKMIAYCQNNQMVIEQVILARTLRWQDLSLPKHEQYRTALPEPRNEALTTLNSYAEQRDFQKLFDCAEQLFLEGCNQYLLDLQYHTCQALDALNAVKAKQHLEFMLKQLLDTLPALTDLMFKNGHRFANEQTQQWLSTLCQPQAAVVDKENVQQNKTHQYFLKQVTLRANTKNLKDKLAYLNDMPVKNHQEKVEKAFAIAKLLSTTQTELASIQYQAIMEQIESEQMIKWLPTLSSQILIEYRKLLLGTRNNPQLNKVTKLLCLLAPELAIPG